MSHPKPKVEQRRYVRVPVQVPTTVASRATTFTRDVSYQGLSVTMPDPPPLNHLVRLRLDLPSGVLDLHGVVVRVLNMPGRNPTVGLRLFALNGEEKTVWDDFVTSALRAVAKAA